MKSSQLTHFPPSQDHHKLTAVTWSNNLTLRQ